MLLSRRRIHIWLFFQRIVHKICRILQGAGLWPSERPYLMASIWPHGPRLPKTMPVFHSTSKGKRMYSFFNLIFIFNLFMLLPCFGFHLLFTRRSSDDFHGNHNPRLNRKARKEAFTLSKRVEDFAAENLLILGGFTGFYLLGKYSDR